MTLEQHVATAPQWVQWWVTWVMVVNMAALLFLVRWYDGKFNFGHVEAYAIVAAILATIVFMHWLLNQFGYVRLLGLGHIPFWTPLAVFIWMRLPRHPPKSTFGIYLRVFLVTTIISLAFDYADVARYIAGERAPM